MMLNAGHNWQTGWHGHVLDRLLTRGYWHEIYQNQVPGHMTRAVTQGPIVIAQEGLTFGLILCGGHLEIFNNF